MKSTYLPLNYLIVILPITLPPEGLNSNRKLVAAPTGGVAPRLSMALGWHTVCQLKPYSNSEYFRVFRVGVCV